MPEINILSPHVADLIAAGEVVERPASVIKELCENSFDANAKNITIELSGGGLTYIRVTDDGCGMSPEDAGVCFLRHATSKLKNERGLEAIGTMGFRGEALAAIASVSRIELITRRRGENEGTRVMLEAGEIIEMCPFGCPEGTTMIIRDLFYNTPARLKFMKSDRAEGGNCVSVTMRCALGRPEVSVRLIKDGKEEFFSPGDGKPASAVYSLLGRDTAKELLEFSSTDGDIKVFGFVGSPKFGHGNRAKQFIFCNGRCIKSALLQAAVEQAYKNTLLTGRYPACVVYLSISPACVDVNVHPAKIEVKFREERRVFDAVHYAALSAIQGEGATAEICLSTSTQAVSSPKKDFFKSMTAGEYKEKYSSAPKTPSTSSTMPSTHIATPKSTWEPSKPAPVPDRGTVVLRGSGAECAAIGTRVCDSTTRYKTARDDYSAPMTLELYPGAPVPNDLHEDNSQHHSKADSPESRQASSQGGDSTHCESGLCEQSFSAVLPEFRLIGEAMRTYIILEKDDTLILIDKHAAHERMIFDRLKQQGHEIMSQALLIPVTIKLSAEEMELIEQNEGMLSHLGFEIEPFGADTMILRAAPADTDAADVPAMVEEICEKLKRGGISANEATDDILHTVACKAAIKAGWKTSDDELLSIAREVTSGRVKYCPHGRPVATSITKKQLDKEFSRIV